MKRDEIAPTHDITVKQNEPSIDDGIWPKVVWLLSFPNSGTSYTIQATRELSNCSTASNYALEGKSRDEPSVPAVAGRAGENGPFLDVIPKFHGCLPRYILTKTHCSGYCDNCSPDAYLETPRSFQIGCRSGFRGVQKNNEIKLVPVTYNVSLVKKAIHIFRNPLDNVVARFHLLTRSKRNFYFRKVNNTRIKFTYQNNKRGFDLWCRNMDKEQRPLTTKMR
jgi:hypothetical protein